MPAFGLPVEGRGSVYQRGIVPDDEVALAPFVREDETVLRRVVQKLEQLRPARYKFGSHIFYVGEALSEILSYLEKRYDLNFNELENAYKQKNNM